MPRRMQVLRGLALTLGFFGLALLAVAKQSRSPAAFTVASVRFEQNPTEGDVRGRLPGAAKMLEGSPREGGSRCADF
jgi:hypothetical protein